MYSSLNALTYTFDKKKICYIVLIIHQPVILVFIIHQISFLLASIPFKPNKCYQIRSEHPLV